MKKQTLKRVLVASLAAAMSVTAFAGCNGGSTTSSAAGTDSATESKAEGGEWTKEDNGIKLNEPGTFPIVQEGQDVTLKIFTQAHLETCADLSAGVNPVTDYMEKRIGTKFDWQMVTKADKQAKLNLLFTDDTDQLPDIIFYSYFDQATQNHYGEEGLLEPLNDYIDKNAYFYTEYVKNGYDLGVLTDEQQNSLKTPDGKIYGLGQYQGAVHSTYASRMWMYEPWLKATGKEMPTTTDEFYDVLKAIKDTDCNGNGDTKDEIPLTGSTKGWNTNPTPFIMNSFVYYSGYGAQRKAYVDDGKVVLSYMQDAFKDGIKYLNKLNDEGLLLGDTWTQDANALKALTTQDVQKVGFAPGGSITAFTTVTGEGGDWLNWKALPPLKGPNGVQYADTMLPYPGANIKFNITTNCKYKTIAFRFGDALYDTETAITTKQGLQGEYWDYAQEGELGLDGKQAKYKLLNGGEAQSAAKNYAWSQISVNAEPLGWHTACAPQGDPATNMEQILYNAATPYAKYAAPSEMILPPLFFEDDDAKRLSDLQTDLNSAFDQAFTAMVTGKPSEVDGLWDNFQTEIKNLGVEDLLALYQTAYDNRAK